MKGSLFLPVLVFFSIFSFACFAQDTIMPDSVKNAFILVDDDPVASMLDSLVTLKIFEDNESPHANKYQDWENYTETDIPVFPDSVYRERIAEMNDQSPFEYVYNNEVKQFIELYGVRKRKLTARILGLSQIYFPLFEEQLDKYDMPLELKYLAVIESALNPVANSRVGAKGLWQFMYGTGKVYGLKVTSYVDDRFDPYKSTIAACEHLQDLYDIYGNWSLALAAYNSGAGNVNKAIRRSGGIKNFWAIHQYLPRETRSYVPAFIAASYVMTYSKEHKINPIDPGILYYEVDTVTTYNPLTFDQISEFLKIPRDELAFLNPSFKQGVIPASPENPYKLRLRKKYIGDFIANENTLYAYKTREGQSKDSLLNLVYNSYRETQQYKVKSGETMSSVAKKFGMTVTELKTLNNLKKNYLKVNQRLLVYTKSSAVKTNSSLTSSSSTNQGTNHASENDHPAQKPAPNQSATKSIHVVKSGESLGLIASKYQCTVSELMQWNNLSSSKILVGQKLKVSGQAQSASGETASKMTTTASSARFFYYTIQPGDNLWDIANKFDVTVSQIKNLNAMKNASRIKPGQKIKVPK